MSPYSNEHSARLLDPDLFETCRRTERESEGKKYGVLTCRYKKGKTPEGKSEWAEQSYRYSIDTWTEEEAKAHCEKAKGTFEPAEPEVKATHSNKFLTETHKYFFASPVALKEGEHTIDVEILREGQWRHPKAPNGILRLTRERIQAFLKNFEAGIVGVELPCDIDHKPDESGTIGWLKQMWINTKDGLAHLFARLDIVDPETQEAVKLGKLKYFSPQIETDYEDPETGLTYDIIRSGALTNWPFIKNMKPCVLNFSEIKQGEITPDRKEATLLLTAETNLDNARKVVKYLMREQIKLNDKINKLELNAKLEKLSNEGRIKPYEMQQLRELKDPAKFAGALLIIEGRDPIVEFGQRSILVQKPRSRMMDLNDEIEAIDKEKDPEKRSKKIRLITEKVEGMKERRGIR